MHRIASRILRRTVALRLIVINSTSSLDPAAGVSAKIVIADTDLMGITVAAWSATALKSASSFATLGVNTTRSPETLISARFAIDLRISVVSWWAGALSSAINNATLRVEAADSVLKTRISADSIIAAPFGRFAVLVTKTLQLVALLAWFTLIAFRTQTDCAMT